MVSSLASVRPHPKLWLRKASFCGRPKQSDYTMRVSRTAAPTITLVILHTALLLHAESRMHRARAYPHPAPVGVKCMCATRTHALVAVCLKRIGPPPCSPANTWALRAYTYARSSAHTQAHSRTPDRSSGPCGRARDPSYLSGTSSGRELISCRNGRGFFILN